MLLSSEPASQNSSAEPMHDTSSSVCWKSTPVPCAHDRIVLLPPLQATAYTQACSVAWLRRPASLHWRCGTCLCVNHKICSTLTNSGKSCAASLAGSRGTIVVWVQIISCLSAASIYYLKKSYFDSLPLHFTFLFFPPTFWWHFLQV